VKSRKTVRGAEHTTTPTLYLTRIRRRRCATTRVERGLQKRGGTFSERGFRERCVRGDGCSESQTPVRQMGRCFGRRRFSETNSRKMDV